MKLKYAPTQLTHTHHYLKIYVPQVKTQRTQTAVMGADKSSASICRYHRLVVAYPFQS